MDITINKGTTDAIIDIEDLLNLLEYKVVALRSYKDKDKHKYINVDQKIIDTLDSHSRLQEYLLSIYKKE